MFTVMLAVPVNFVLKYLKTGRVRQPQAVREAWAEHGQHDTYVSLSQLRQICRAILPGAQVKKHLLWRYSLIWKKGTNEV
jgi:hypothetical protein